MFCPGPGLSNAEIGRRLFMSEVTVKAHVSRVLAKLGMSNRVQAAILAHDAGLLDQRLERGWPIGPGRSLLARNGAPYRPTIARAMGVGVCAEPSSAGHG